MLGNLQISKMTVFNAPLAGPTRNKADCAKKLKADSPKMVDLERKKKLKAERDKRYRMKKKIEEELSATDADRQRKRNINAERNRKYRLKKKKEYEKDDEKRLSALLANSERCRRYRMKKKMERTEDDYTPEMKLANSERCKKYRLRKKMEKMGLLYSVDQFEKRSMEFMVDQTYTSEPDLQRRREVKPERTRKIRVKNKKEFQNHIENTCVDAVFSRQMDMLGTLNYISYFSYLVPALPSNQLIMHGDVRLDTYGVA